MCDGHPERCDFAGKCDIAGDVRLVRDTDAVVAAMQSGGCVRRPALSRGVSDRSIWFRSNVDIEPLYHQLRFSELLIAASMPPAEDDLHNGSICYGLSYAREDDRSR